MTCFRPLIGVSFCKHIMTYIIIHCNFVSVPLSELASVNQFLMNSTMACILYRFRPLIRVSFCKLYIRVVIILRVIHLRFRPLIGVSFCKLGRIEAASNWDDIGFRPLIGVSFCKLKKNGWKNLVSSFRPLIGVSFCKPYPFSGLINRGFQGALACLKFNKRF